MNQWEIILGILFGLLVNEITDVSPWLAKKLVRWSAYRWTSDPGLAEAYADEWAAIIEDRPGKLFKLLTALRFALAAAGRSAARSLTLFQPEKKNDEIIIYGNGGGKWDLPYEIRIPRSRVRVEAKNSET
ncbi:hypothetical protein [Micromonospora sp. NBRC 101691]|uniref:hypothetical protein n=1 Tax=Micromonospora sp. NBRC 101691 TaxID=3032198 RepID=UPI00249FFB15|nr:hypothetical protein [Micromonospora sp. NBRC 101691]GLY24751.1 hypothetical protein Misp04_44830 [Micromonospora sp. NBRC 101691]